MLEPEDRKRLETSRREMLVQLRTTILCAAAFAAMVILSQFVTELWQGALCYVALVATIALTAIATYRFVRHLVTVYVLSVVDRDNDNFFYSSLMHYIEKENGA